MGKFTVGRPEVIVGLVDGGADLAHPDLAKNCIPGNGEGSWNFVDNNDKIVAHQHGTHVAGIIAAINNNGMGVCGVAGGDAAAGKSGVKLLSCQIFQTNPNTGKDRGGNTASAVTWAADHGAVIINNSWGYTPDANGDGKSLTVRKRLISKLRFPLRTRQHWTTSSNTQDATTMEISALTLL